MAAPTGAEKPHELASRVLRRAQVSKMTRALQDRLALANVKIRRGWQHRSIDSLEPEIEKELKRKRADSAADMFSDTSSNVSGHCFSSGIPASSPLTGPIFSDDLPRSASSHGSAKRIRTSTAVMHAAPSFNSRIRPQSVRPVTASWKTTYHLPQSSPIRRSRIQRYSDADLQNASFVSETSTILDSASASEDDDQDLPLHSFHFSADDIPSSPPRTPPPDVARSARLSRSKAFSSPVADSKGADLLLYLASSPSPAMRINKSSANAPATPPTKNTPLPSSMMSTPGGQTYVGFAPTTPSTAFNFADYVNITPSPAQGNWSRTPAAAKTPLAAREARKRLNYDALMPPPGLSPNMTRPSGRRETGLGMELGGEVAG